LSAALVVVVGACGSTSAATTASPSASAQAASPSVDLNLWQRSTALAYDSTHGYVMLFGGRLNRSELMADTWIHQGGHWVQLHPAVSPPAREGSVLVDEPEMRAVLLFGGHADGGDVGDTWAWDGTNWTRLAPAQSPSPRAGAAATFDPVRHVVLLFGGSSGSDETWTWNGQGWTQAKPAQSPPGRSFGRLAVDVAGGNAVLFGGHGALTDTWTWDGVTWTQRQTSTTPAGSTDEIPETEQMAYDSDRKQIVLAAPNAGTHAFDTFTWSGSDWSKLNPATSPPFARGAGMAYDAADSIIILAGGYPIPTTVPHTWGWDGTNWSALN
jgi:hypothetical protein